MPQSQSPAATVSMKAWVIPAPAPWAKTKHACGDDGRSSSAETASAPSISIFSCCGLAVFITLQFDRKTGVRRKTENPRLYLPLYFNIQSPWFL